MPPKYALKELPPSPRVKTADLVEVDGPYWNLRTIQAALKDGAIEWFLTATAEEDLRDELQFDDADLDNFLQVLHVACCRRRASQWCLEPRSPSSSAVDTRVQRLADVYVMGFNRFTGKEQPTAHPGVYIKFTVTEAPSLLIYSVHRERK